ncbi:Metacaspase-8 [Raphanus sativus]|uniref:Metacaspase-8-like n=1 Tax=Raphanus sativus TaxID=3726 RepID=A0A9W3D101_RAPSA|nr:metacaspase-8-like [Raphanus sativus]KAJ4866582.1 Metacaspase-8 [Raphanus sativus]
MTKRALLIGINYPGTSVELRGCVNDVRRMHRCLTDRYGFSNDNITVLIDTETSGPQPTGKNIRDALNKLIADGESGDTLVVHYSGHGTRLPTEEGVLDATGFDECITPCDMNLITDNEFRDMVAEVKEGCRLTIISDSCHSGGLIEEAKEQIGESHVNHPKPPWFASLFACMLATCGTSSSWRGRGGSPERLTRDIKFKSEDGETVDRKTRSIPLDSYIALFKEQTGQTDVKPGKIRQTLADVFGQDSSPGVAILSSSMKINGAGSKHPDNGILLSGCQTDQKSEDVHVVSTGKAYGAFSDAIQTILSATGKDKKITNRDIVVKARDILKRRKFRQRPGLYCHDRYVNEPFIC